MSLFAGWLLLLGGLLLAGALLVWVLLPLREGGALPAAEDARLLALLMEREGSLASLRDLDADLAAGRISAPLQAPLRESVLAQGSRILAAIDESLARVAGDQREAVARLEAEVALHRERGPVDAARAAARPPALVTCPACGRVTAAEDRFCRHCGRDLRKGKPA
jgi:hypothetical protein